MVAVLGRGVLDEDEPVVTADDLGLTRGDGCFDSARVVTDATSAARVVDSDGHLDRLACSAQAMAIGNPSRDQWRGLVAEAQAGRSTPGEAVLNLVLTRGREWRAVGPTAIVTITHRWPWSATGDGAGEASRTITAVTLTAATRPTPSPTRPGSWAVSRPCPTSSTPPPHERHNDAGRRRHLQDDRRLRPGGSDVRVAPGSSWRLHQHADRRHRDPGVAHRGVHLGDRARRRVRDRVRARPR